MNAKKIKHLMLSEFSRSIITPLISLFLLLVTVITMTVFVYFVTELRTNIEDSKRKQLELIAVNMSSRLREIESISYHISADKNFLLRPISDRENSGYEMSEMLKRLLAGNNFIAYLTYYRMFDPLKLYTSSGEMSYHNFWKGVIELEGYTEEGFLELIKDTKETTIIPLTKSAKSGAYLTVINPIPQYSSRPVAFVTSFISGSQMRLIVGTLFTDCYGEVLIFDRHGNLVYEGGNTQKNLYSQIAEAREYLGEKNYFTTVIDGEKYMVQRHISSYNNWTYLSIIRMSDIMSNLHSKQHAFLLISFFILLLSIITTLVCILRKYSPINQLAEQVMVHAKGDGVKEMAFNEQRLLSNAFSSLIEERKNVHKEIFYLNLLSDQYDEDNCLDTMDQYDIHFKYPYFSAFSICIANDGKTSKEINERLATLIENTFCPNTVDCYFMYRSNPEQILVTMNHETVEFVADVLVIKLNSVHNIVYEQFGLTLKFGIGNVYSSILHLSTSTNEATNAMYFCNLTENCIVMKYEDVELETESNREVISKCKSSLIDAVSGGDVAGVHSIIRELETSCTRLALPELDMNYIAYHMITSLLEYTESSKTAEEMKDTVKRLGDGSYMVANIFEQIIQFGVKIANEELERGAKQSDELMEKIKGVILEHLYDSSLSLDKLASFCGISSSYLSRVFGSNMECTPMKYVDNLRMELVKKDLCTTDKSLKQILEEKGYIDTSNFIRKFKRIEGVTPIAYRELCRESEEKLQNEIRAIKSKLPNLKGVKD